MQDPDEIAAVVARSVRDLRRQRSLTIDALASAAGLSRGTVLAVESARSNPSIATLVRLAAALGVGVSSLVDAQPVPKVTIRRAAAAVPLWSSPAGSQAVLQIGTDPPDTVELWDWTLRVGDHFDGEAHTVGTIEVLSVRSGTLLVRVGQARHRLAAGDTMFFEAFVPHRYANDGDEPVSFTMVVVQFGESGLGSPTGIAPAQPGLLDDPGPVAPDGTG